MRPSGGSQSRSASGAPRCKREALFISAPSDSARSSYGLLASWLLEAQMVARVGFCPSNNRARSSKPAPSTWELEHFNRKKASLSCAEKRVYGCKSEPARSFCGRHDRRPEECVGANALGRARSGHRLVLEITG